MAIQIDQQLREEIKKQKLRQLMVRYIELEMDKIAHEANGLSQATVAVQGEIDKVKTAYEAIEKS